MSLPRELVPLLPHRARVVGGLLLAAGLAMAIMVIHFGHRPSFFDLNVFAVHSAFFKSESFHWIRKNMSAEITMILSLAGLFCLAFSRERNESAASELLRLRALALSVIGSTVLLSVSVLTVFGIGFVYVLVANVFLTLLSTVVLFRSFMWRAGREAMLVAREAP